MTLWPLRSLPAAALPLRDGGGGARVCGDGGAFSWRDVVARHWAFSPFGASSSVAAAAFAARVAYILAADREMSAACLCGG